MKITNDGPDKSLDEVERALLGPEDIEGVVDRMDAAGRCCGLDVGALWEALRQAENHLPRPGDLDAGTPLDQLDSAVRELISGFQDAVNGCESPAEPPAPPEPDVEALRAELDAVKRERNVLRAGLAEVGREALAKAQQALREADRAKGGA